MKTTPSSSPTPRRRGRRPPPARRADLEHALHHLGARLTGAFANWDRLTREAQATRPDVLDGLEERMNALRLAFDVESAAQDTDTAELLTDLIDPFVRARVPLRARGIATAWAHGIVVGLLERFARTDAVHATYDHDWIAIDDEPNRPAVVTRLALGAAWLAWSDRLVDPASATAHLDVLGRLLDRLEGSGAPPTWDLDGFEHDAVLAAVSMERRLRGTERGMVDARH